MSQERGTGEPGSCSAHPDLSLCYVLARQNDCLFLVPPGAFGCSEGGGYGTQQQGPVYFSVHFSYLPTPLLQLS